METGLLSLPCAGVLASTLPVVNDQRCWNSSCSLLRPSSTSSSSALVSHSFSDWVCVRRSKRSPPSVTTGRCVAQVDRATVFGSGLARDVRKKNRRNVQVHADKSGSSASAGDGSVPATLEQSRRLLAKQKELLGQIEEQKKLYAALKRNTTPGESDQDNATDESTLFTGRQTEHSRASPIEGLTSENAEFEDDSGEVSGQNSTKSLGRGALAASWPSPVLPRTSSPKEPRKAQVKTSFGPPVEPFSKSVVPSLNSSVTADPTVWEDTDLIIPPSSSRPTTDLEEEEAVEDNETEDIDEGPPLAGANVMNVILVAAECAPWSKTGGLGDVVGALPKALARRGHRVMVVAPRYSNYAELWDTSIRKRFNINGQDMEVGYFHGYRDKVDFVFVDSPVFHNYASNIYGGSRQEVLLRMVLLCKAAVEAPWHVPCGGVPYGDGNLVFIANDWHTALLPVYLRAYYQDKGLMPFARCVLVIHNMAHQGRGPPSDFNKLGLPPHYADKFILDDPIGGEHCNIFKAGFLSCHRIVTVSRGYAQEVQTNEGGWGLAGIIRENSWKLRGVVNGIDEKEWNPEIDPFLKEDGYSNYSLEDMSGKALCKAALQKELGLPVRSDVPLIGFIGRLDSQKGVDIIADAMPWMTSRDLQLVLLGSGRRDLEDMLRSLEGRHKDKVRGWVGFSVKTAHRITAGVDILLMPSRFEPCGLNQLYAMKYGTIPVVHSVGGLKDTVQPFNPYGETGTGWTFDRAEASGLIHALGNAMWTYLDFKESWKALQERGMSQDLSWDNAAQLYEEILVAAKYQW